MTGISIQFHALPQELVSLVSEYVQTLGLHVTAVCFQPFNIFVVDVGQLEQAFLDRTVRWIVLTLDQPVLGAETPNGFLDRNLDALLLEIGRLTDGGLKESWLTARTSDPEAIKIWKRVARKLRGMTRAGVVVTNPWTGVTGKDKNHRFTEGAQALQAKGVVMLPLAGVSIIRLPD